MPDRTATILVVDDNPATRYSTSRVLKAAGFVVIEAATGGEALAQAEKGPDLVVLDVNLPDMNGYDVCRMLRSRPDSARTPVVHLSATFVSDVDKVLGFEAGADGYITHPVEPPVLVATVNAFLRARHAEEAMRESEAKFRSIFDHALNGIALLDPSMVVIDANPAVLGMLGMRKEDVVGRAILEFISPEYAGTVQKMDAGLQA